MIELSILEQLVEFANCGTLSETAERLHTSQPALTRSMKKLEEKLDVKLFERKKNHLSLNETGRVAVDYAIRVLQSANDFESRTIAYDRSLHTISIGFCAPIPQRVLTPILNNVFEGMTISSDMKSDRHFLEKLEKNSYQLIVVHEKPDEELYFSKKIGHEDLFFSVTVSDPFAFYPELHLADLSGHSILLLNQIGFWMDVVKEHVIDPHFIVQYEQQFFEELARLSELPYFTSNCFVDGVTHTPGRIEIPIVDSMCRVDYYLVCKKENKKRFQKLFKQVSENLI